MGVEGKVMEVIRATSKVGLQPEPFDQQANANSMKLKPILNISQNI